MHWIWLVVTGRSGWIPGMRRRRHSALISATLSGECSRYRWGLSNAPATFRALMSNIFRDHGLGEFVAVYLDDILVYSRTAEEHVERMQQVLQVLRSAKDL